MLAGTKRPPFRLYCNAVVPPGANFRVRPAVSEEFVVSRLNSLLPSYGSTCSHQGSSYILALTSYYTYCCD